MLTRPRNCWLTLPVIIACTLSTSGEDPKKPAKSQPAVSYFQQVRPIFQAHCQGCHQPAKASHGYVMTEFAKLLEGGDSEEAAIVAKHPEQSKLIDQITPENGKAKMPPEKSPPPHKAAAASASNAFASNIPTRPRLFRRRRSGWLGRCHCVRRS